MRRDKEKKGKMKLEKWEENHKRLRSQWGAGLQEESSGSQGQKLGIGHLRKDRSSHWIWQHGSRTDENSCFREDQVQWAKNTSRHGTEWGLQP